MLESIVSESQSEESFHRRSNDVHLMVKSADLIKSTIEFLFLS